MDIQILAERKTEVMNVNLLHRFFIANFVLFNSAIRLDSFCSMGLG